MSRLAALLPLLAAASCSLTACQRANFESLGFLPARAGATAPRYDAGAPDARTASDAAPPGSIAIDAGIDAGQSSPATAAVGGSAGPPAAGSSAGAPAAPAALSGKIGSTTFTALTGHVSGLSDEYATTTLYLFDSDISCAQLSMFAWLSQLPSSVNVIQVTFPTMTMPGTPATNVTVSYAHGGMYTFVKTRASMITLLLSHVVPTGDVDGTLTAMFGTDSIHGTFHADYCATGTTL